MNASVSRRRWLLLTAPLPALFLGVLTMKYAGLSTAVWGQNLAAGLALAVVCALLPARVRIRPGLFWWVALSTLGLMALTWLDRGSDGVHRWVQAGPLRIHAGAVCLPALIIALGLRLRRREDRHRLPPVLLVGTTTLALLALQPDAAQATAFAGALLVLLFFGRESARVLAVAALVAAAGLVLAWTRPDPLLPVRHVEEIVGMAAENGPFWRVGALAALALLPLPFLFAGRAGGVPVSLGAYFSLYLLGCLVGVFPVPVIGFGLSPMIGYYTALGWLVASEGGAEN